MAIPWNSHSRLLKMAPFDSLAAELWPKKTILPRCVVTRCLSVRPSVRPSVCHTPVFCRNSYTPWGTKTCHLLFVHNFDKCWLIFKTFSLLDSAVNLPRPSWHISNHTCNVSLQYLMKKRISYNKLLIRTHALLKSVIWMTFIHSFLHKFKNKSKNIQK